MPDFVADVMEKVQQLTEIGKSAEEKQHLINVSEVFYVWDIMVMKYDILNTIRILENFINQKDLKFIAEQLAKGLTQGITAMELIMEDYSIPFPVRPPAGNKTTDCLENITEKYIFEAIYEGAQSFFPVLASGFMNSTSPKVRKAFKNHLLLTIELLELIVEYGKLKGLINEPPVYRT